MGVPTDNYSSARKINKEQETKNAINLGGGVG